MKEHNQIMQLIATEMIKSNCRYLKGNQSFKGVGEGKKLGNNTRKQGEYIPTEKTISFYSSWLHFPGSWSLMYRGDQEFDNYASLRHGDVIISGWGAVSSGAIGLAATHLTNIGDLKGWIRRKKNDDLLSIPEKWLYHQRTAGKQLNDLKMRGGMKDLI